MPPKKKEKQIRKERGQTMKHMLIQAHNVKKIVQIDTKYHNVARNPSTQT
jgi:hypothetical protein